jgi:hypothetical protein
MDAAHISALSALAGSAMGGLTSIATTWLTQHAQDRAQRKAEAIAHRQRLYEEFIEEASRSYADALTHDLEDPARVVHLYALVGKLRLFAPKGIIVHADEVMRIIVATYDSPNRSFRERQQAKGHIDVIRAFAEVSRDDLRA